MRAHNWRPGDLLPILISYPTQTPVGTGFLTSKETIMTTITNKQTLSNPAPAQPFSLMFIIETLFAVNLREKVDANTGGDKSDAKYTWGM
jgi:hypothetical protein